MRTVKETSGNDPVTRRYLVARDNAPGHGRWLTKLTPCVNHREQPVLDRLLVVVNELKQVKIAGLVKTTLASSRNTGNRLVDVTNRWVTITHGGFGGTGTVGATTVTQGVISAGTLTSPTGIQELERFDGTNAAARIWEVIEAKRRG